jgi:hypothetical protein
MLGKAGARRLLILGATTRRCTCPECDLTPDRKTQRAREKRAWLREVER